MGNPFLCHLEHREGSVNDLQILHAPSLLPRLAGEKNVLNVP